MIRQNTQKDPSKAVRGVSKLGKKVEKPWFRQCDTKKKAGGREEDDEDFLWELCRWKLSGENLFGEGSSGLNCMMET